MRKKTKDTTIRKIIKNDFEALGDAIYSLTFIFRKFDVESTVTETASCFNISHCINNLQPVLKNCTILQNKLGFSFAR